MERAQLESLRRKLAKPNREVMGDVARQIARKGEAFPKEILDVFIEPLRQGMWIDLAALESAVIAARDRDLYIAAKPFLAGSDRLIGFLKAKLADAGIEQKLCEELWDCKPGNELDNVRRSSSPMR